VFVLSVVMGAWVVSVLVLLSMVLLATFTTSLSCS